MFSNGEKMLDEFCNGELSARVDPIITLNFSSPSVSVVSLAEETETELEVVSFLFSLYNIDAN